jgi:hypothetical protein
MVILWPYICSMRMRNFEQIYLEYKAGYVETVRHINTVK